MKKLSIILMALFVLFSGAVFAADTIKLGVAGAHSGDLASYGLPTLNAAKLVVGDVNAKGGILGKKVEILPADDVCKPEVAANVASKLVSDKANVVLGHICSGATKAALNTYKDAKMITISPSATNVDLTKSGDYPNFFRTISPDDAQAKLEVDFAMKLKVKKVAIIHDKGDYGKGLAEFAQADFEKRGIKPVLFEGITPGAVDYSAIVQKIKNSGAEAVIYGGYHPEAAKIVTAMKKKKMKTFFISDDGVKDDTFIKVAAEFAEGVYATGPMDTSKNPMAVAAIEQHKKVYGSEPGAFYLNAYAATQCILQAIEKAGSTNYDAIAKALRTNWFETPLGKISFDQNGDAKGIGFSMYQVQKGKYVEVK
jgi:branched-chain amino acid transport system substrate-binding protein